LSAAAWFPSVDRGESWGSRRPIPVSLGPDFLAATAVALIAFDDVRR
jgi:hypothetical protein